MYDVCNTYRTLFLLRTKKLTEPVIFTDVLGREHHVEIGDYLVQSSHGLRVAPREVFEDVYVLFKAEDVELPSPSTAVLNPESLTI
jgi:hypothetical protein